VRAAVTTEGHGFDIVDVADPSPAPDELLIRVAACGVCGSDIKAQLCAPAGMIMGHAPRVCDARRPAGNLFGPG
jgi:(R,R)-butanediol dehydrogenase / meso-butanediol dehydrogenase / diacetyl reductase